MTVEILRRCAQSGSQLFNHVVGGESATVFKIGKESGRNRGDDFESLSLSPKVAQGIVPLLPKLTDSLA